MNEVDLDNQKQGDARLAGLRLVRVIIVETVLVAFAGLLVWGLAWESGYSRVGLIIAIIIWLTVSPVVEIATVLKYRGPHAHSGFKR